MLAKVTVSNTEQEANALSYILVTFAGIIMDVIGFCSKAVSPIVIRLLVSAKVTVANLIHP